MPNQSSALTIAKRTKLKPTFTIIMFIIFILLSVGMCFVHLWAGISLCIVSVLYLVVSIVSIISHNKKPVDYLTFASGVFVINDTKQETVSLKEIIKATFRYEQAAFVFIETILRKEIDYGYLILETQDRLYILNKVHRPDVASEVINNMIKESEN